MVAGIIVVAAGDQLVLRGPGAVGHTAVSVMLLGGTALYLLGHAGFKAVIWGGVPWTRIGGVVVLAALGGLAPYLPAVALSVCVALAVVAVAAADSLLPAARRPPAGTRSS
jgi:low temperature requirement protein LtrA